MTLREAVVRGSAVPRAELVEWRDWFGLVAGVTERGSGAEPFNLGISTGESAGAVTGRWSALRSAFRPGFTDFRLAHQVHGTAVAWRDRREAGWHVHDDLDGHATDLAGVLLCVSIADCVPVYLAAREGSVCALLHAGWRGTAAGVLESGLESLRLRGVEVPEISIHLGVAICGKCYEVGPEILGAVLGRLAGGKGRLDLREVLARRAEAAGVKRVSVSPLCTACDRDRFVSHRASGGTCGRQIAYLGRPAAEWR